ncbi:MAG: dihydroneopterin aldolase [Victivallales bacterium]|nr:dihydroneopterin aldolase [Victivallales bacterium]
MDTIQLQNISINSILGCYPEERNVRRPVKIFVTIYTDITKCAASGDLADAIDYDKLTQEIIDFAESSSYNLIESLAENLAKLCLEKASDAAAVDITVTKPHPRAKVEQVSITIHRERPTA